MITEKTVILAGILCVLYPAQAHEWANAEGGSYRDGLMSLISRIEIEDFGVFSTYDYGTHDAVSVGVSVASASCSEKVGGEEITYQEFPVSLRSAFHPFNLAVFTTGGVPMRDKLDVYVGLGAGYCGQFISNGDSCIFAGGTFFTEAYIGARYYCMNQLYLTAELGTGMAMLNCGISYVF